jgi:hypothetical protein
LGRGHDRLGTIDLQWEKRMIDWGQSIYNGKSG